MAVSLEEEVSEIMDRALRRAPSVLEATTGGNPVSDQETIELLTALQFGQSEAILRIAREIDKM
jgi:hypothetical protein